MVLTQPYTSRIITWYTSVAYPQWFDLSGSLHVKFYPSCQSTAAQAPQSAEKKRPQKKKEKKM